MPRDPISPAGSQAERTGVRRPLRADIQGLRAVAVLAVLLWHANAPFATGGFVGVDVFFVISGFLMTKLLVDEAERTGRVSLPRFYARRVRRLLPAASAALVGVLALTWLTLPVDRWRGIGGDVVASALYVVNWRLADQSVDYLAEGAAASPVQHFWSLSLEEQYYAVWPLLVALVGLTLAARARVRARLGLLLLGISAASFAWSVHLTATQPERAYFVSTTRLWELGLGGLVAIAAPWFAARAPRPGAAAALVVTGLFAIGWSVLALDTSDPFPGWVAAVPTLGAAAVIAFGPWCAGRADPRRLLAPAPVQWVGGISYSLYLWHWPLIVTAAATGPGGDLTATRGAAAAALSVVPAWLSYRFVEEPFRRTGARVRPAPGRALRLGAACTALSLLCGGVLLVRTELEAREQGRLAAQVAGAAAVGTATAFVPQDGADVLVPSPAVAREDVFHPWYDGGCSPGPDSDEIRSCVFGDSESRERVVVVGDSHAVMWLPALDVVAKQRHWRLEVLAKTDCPLADVVVMHNVGRHRSEPSESCASWNRKVHERLSEDPPLLVVAAQVNVYVVERDGRRADRPTSRRLLADGLARTWRALLDRGVAVASLVDVPRWPADPVECVGRHRDELRRCAAPAADVLDPAVEAQRRAFGLVPQVRQVDLTDRLCPRGVCPAVIGDVLVYRDGNHLSATYARSLAPYLAGALAGVGP